MDVFIKVDKEFKAKKTKKNLVDFVPDFPGIYCDLDMSVSPDHCDHYLGTAGLGSEFFIQDNRISKMFIELLPYNAITIRDLSQFINFFREQKEVSDYLIKEIEHSNQIYPNSIVFDTSWNCAIIIYSDETNIDTLHKDCYPIKISDNIIIWINSNNNSLDGILIFDFWNRIYSNGSVINVENSKKNEIRTFLELLKMFFNSSISSLQYASAVKKYLNNELKNSVTKNKDEQIRILKSLMAQKEWLSHQ